MYFSIVLSVFMFSVGRNILKQNIYGCIQHLLQHTSTTLSCFMISAWIWEMLQVPYCENSPQNKKGKVKSS